MAFPEPLSAPALSPGVPSHFPTLSSVSYDVLTGEQTAQAPVFNNSHTVIEKKKSTKVPGHTSLHGTINVASVCSAHTKVCATIP